MKTKKQLQVRQLNTHWT